MLMLETSFQSAITISVASAAAAAAARLLLLRRFALSENLWRCLRNGPSFQLPHLDPANRPPTLQQQQLNLIWIPIPNLNF